MCRALARVAAPDPPVEHGCVPVLAYPAGRRTEAPCFSGTRLWLAGGGGMDRFLVRPDRGDIQGAAEEPAPTGEASGDMQSPGWQHFRAEGLNCDYTVLFRKAEADQIFRELEQEVEYFTGALAKVQVFGKWHSVPRKQATYGDAGLTYTFSGLTLTPKPWIPVLERVRDQVCRVTGQTFNFVLVNRYKDGCDHIGEHRDDERELAPGSPIASVSFGACRDILFRHKDSRGKRPRRAVEVVRLQLAHGSLLMMNHPTNTHWYHSLPIRKRVLAPRINLTFRKILPTKK
ncbi:DNA oxidative demethylase ALKBH2 isoform X1 [Rattus norvegicus]|uniref:DNA oxidative demethylase ALKBH2 n=2 Tax=Rattus norvegicus TaxID=10116 RepID=A0A0G2K5G5_RAT|nr:DNA oxidative demethylase ALKBH2 isoform X1 [Rattus norvegicus]|eukprot:XP_006249560.1 PREDICTED: DNA oxidative demethylase ALKBH2 isoform X1 [Rattus norvegicus]